MVCFEGYKNKNKSIRWYMGLCQSKELYRLVLHAITLVFFAAGLIHDLPIS
jgi:hypothetical protein